jgi:hypothetical protein
MNRPLEILIVVLLIAWLVGWLVIPTLGGLVHLLLIVVLVLVIVRLVQGRRV